MKSFHLFFFASLSVLSVSRCSCGRVDKDPDVEVFSELRPFTIEIKRERSYFQARNIATRLNRMGVEAYLLKQEAGDGDWYRVVSGALANDSLAVRYTAMLDTVYGLSNVKKIHFFQLDSASRRRVMRDSVRMEVRRIDAEKPAVPQNVYDVLGVFPRNDMFQLRNISVCMLGSRARSAAKEVRLDLPRGVSLRKLADMGCSSFASVIFQDNLYDARVTLQVARCRDLTKVVAASMAPFSDKGNVEALAYCSELADLILGTGEYKDEVKNRYEVKAYKRLSGYIVSFTSKAVRRTYYILTDADGEFIFIAQSSKTDETTMKDFLKEIGRSEGLTAYDEFYNTFYIVANKMVDDDEFLLYHTKKLSRNYAYERGNALWARKLVGCWSSVMSYYNGNKGLWNSALFDLVSSKQCRYVYNDLYLSDAAKWQLCSIYGNRGRVLTNRNGQLEEVSVGCDRYVVAVGPSENRNFSKNDLIRRIEAMQFARGGYADAEGQTAEDAEKAEEEQ